MREENRDVLYHTVETVKYVKYSGTKFKRKSNNQCRKLLHLIARHLQDLRHSYELLRRRGQQRRSSRFAMLRTYYLQHLRDMELEYLHLLPISASSQLFQNARPEDSQLQTGTNNLRFYEDQMPNFTEAAWLSNFRMRKQCYEWLCEQSDMLQPLGFNAPRKRLIPLGKRVALALYALATGADYRDIAQLFDVSRASVCKFVKRFAEILLNKWGDALLAMPQTEEELNEISQAFQEASHMPAVVGVLGTYEICVNPSQDKLVDFSYDEGNCKIIIQLVVDDKFLFRKVQIDNMVPKLLMDNDNEIAKLPPVMINGRATKRFILTQNHYYPLRPWLMQKYNEVTEPHEHSFNNAADRIFRIRNEAMCRLVGRWQILQRKTDLEPQTMEVIALACCALHNLLEENEEFFQLDKIDRERFTLGSRFKSIVNAALLDENEEALEDRDFVAHCIN